MIGIRTRTLAIAAGILMVAAVAPASAQVTLTTVRATAAYEFFPAHSHDFLAWTQRPTKTSPATSNVVLARVGAGPAFRVNPAGTSASTGGFGGANGDILAFQQVTGGQANIRFYNVLTRRFLSGPAEINTSGEEFHPTLVGSMNSGFLLFGRRSGTTTKVILFDMATHHSKVLDSAGFTLEPGQVNGPSAATKTEPAGFYYADWTRCPSICDVHVYRFTPSTFATGTVHTFTANENRDRYAPSMGKNGTAYWASSATAFGCGASVILDRHTWAGMTTTELYSLPAGLDTRHSYLDDTTTTPALYFDRGRCGGDSNLYKLTGPDVISTPTR
jgi:hypothetical protein